MRIIVSAIALLPAIGLTLPSDADARAPRKADRWGCTFVARGFDQATRFPGEPIVWIGVGLIRGCDTKQAATVTATIFQAIPGARDRVYSRQRILTRLTRYGTGVPLGTRGGTCSAKGSRPAHPFYFVMKVKRKGAPGVVRVATRNQWNPCPEGTWPYRR